MRTFVLLFVLALPPLAICGASYAKGSADIGKPVCTHYDDAASKATDAHTNAGAASAPVASASSATPASTIPAASAKTGGTSSEMRQRNSPRWQAFLPGMFR
ncbi:MAG TPA: hypothetical protein VK753_06125 [Xanthomonadaceae bacterium]|jgi:hypothetical protein|nr:hypothetical protein [Xanthomonadaceae bacterium]